MTQHDGWIEATTLDELWDGEMLSLSLGDVDVLLCHVGGTVFAYRDRCPHLASRLSEGVLDGSVLTCAAHEWVFDVRTGGGVNPATVCLSSYDVRIDGDHILVRVPSEAA
jgi:toluene monooxygenase system ferredoxin subunit